MVKNREKLAFSYLGFKKTVFRKNPDTKRQKPKKNNSD